MKKLVVNFVNVFVAMLLVGTIFGIWFGFNPSPLSAGAYVEVQQEMIRALNVRMPIMGAITIFLTLGSAMLARPDRRAFAILLAATASFVVVGVVTRFLNQPINAIVIAWSANTPPSNWAALRDQWWTWHVIRVVVGLVGFALLTLGITLPASGSKA